MESTTSIATVDMYAMFPRPPVGIPTSREMLAVKTNASLPSKIPVHHICRKASYFRLHDSSEENPSSHESIYEAQMTHTASDASRGSMPRDAGPVLSLRRHTQPVSSDASAKENMNKTSMYKGKYAVDEIEFLYGQGTVLNTITEKNSNGTIHTFARTQSMTDLENLRQLSHRDSIINARTPRQRYSFSTGDLDYIRNSYHNALSAIEKSVDIDPPTYKLIYAEPKVPIVHPPYRPGTPPGMPSWTAHQEIAQSAPRLQAASPKRLRRLFSWRPAKHEVYNVARSMAEQEESARLAIPRFKPPRSVYGPISQHPYSRASMTAKSPQGGIIQPSKPTKTRFDASQLICHVPKIISKHARENNSASVPTCHMNPPIIKNQRTTIIDNHVAPGCEECGGISGVSLDNNPNGRPSTCSSLHDPQLQQSLEHAMSTKISGTTSAHHLHNCHAGYELRGPDYCSTLALPYRNALPVLTPWRTRPTFRQSVESGVPDFSALILDSPDADSVNSRSHLMTGALVDDSSCSPGELDAAYTHTYSRVQEAVERPSVPENVRIVDGTACGGCWKCRILVTSRMVKKWLGQSSYFFCCRFIRTESDSAVQECVRYGTAQVVRSQKGSVVWTGRSTLAL